MADSILDSTKKVLSIDPTDNSFDVDVIMHINAVFTILQQLGIGLEEGFAIVDNEATWESFLGEDLRLNSVKTYVYLKVRLLFDPPATSFHIAAMKDQIQELEWRLSVKRENEAWVDPNPVIDESIY